MTPQRAMPSKRSARRFQSLVLVLLLGLAALSLAGCSSFQKGYDRLVDAFRDVGHAGKATAAGKSAEPSGGTPINKPSPTEPASAGTGATPGNGPSPAAASVSPAPVGAGAAPPAGTETLAGAGSAPSGADGAAKKTGPTDAAPETPGNKPASTPPAKAPAAAGTAAEADPPEGADASDDPNAPMRQTPDADRTVRVGLNIQHLGIGIPLPTFGKNLAVVPAPDGHRCVGLNGVRDSEVYFKGKHFRDFKIEARMQYNFPLREGTTFKSRLLSMRLGDSAERSFDVTISQGEAEPPMALFSVSGPALAPDMFCSTRPIRWREDMPDATTLLRIQKEAGSIRFEYDGQLVCTSPLDPTLTLSRFSVPLVGDGRIYDMALYLLDTDPTVEAAKGKKGRAAKGKAGGTAINGRGATEEAQEEPFPAAEIAHDDGLTHLDLKRLSPGSPVGGVGKNLIVLHDEEGKYLASASPQGSYVLLPATTGKDFTIRILIKNAFVLSDRTGRTDHFFLFRINYKNGVKELFTTDITRPTNILYRNRYYISRSGPDMMDWTAATDYRPWNNALDFNEYKIVKQQGLIRFFFNGEFVRSEKSMGDLLESVKVDLREHERLYDIRVRDSVETGPRHVHPWHTLGDAPGEKTDTAPAKGKQP